MVRNYGELPDDLNDQGITRGPPPAWFNASFDPSIFTAQRVVLNGYGNYELGGFGADLIPKGAAVTEKPSDKEAPKKEEPKKDAKKEEVKPASVATPTKKEEPKAAKKEEAKPATKPAIATGKPATPATKVATGAPAIKAEPPKPTAPSLITPKAVAKEAAKEAAKAPAAAPGVPTAAPAPSPTPTTVTPRPTAPPVITPKARRIYPKPKNLIKNLDRIKPGISKNIPKVAAEYSNIKPQSTMFTADINSYGFGEFTSSKGIFLGLALLVLGAIGGALYCRHSSKKI